MLPEILTLIRIITHINKVANLLKTLAHKLEERADCHDISKFNPDEFEGFCQLDSRRNYSREQYGSKNYEEGIKLDAVKLHHSRNSHHPEYWPNGIKDMGFTDIIEMLCDWEAARQARDIEDDIEKTWQVRQVRFNLSGNELMFLRILWEKIESAIHHSQTH